MTQNASPTFYAQNYATTLKPALQQEGSKLLPYITHGPSVKGFEKAVMVDRIESSEAQTVSGTLQAKQYQNPNTERLWVQPISKDHSQIMDHFEALKMLSDPSSTWVQNARNALGRAWDDEIVESMWRDTKSGQDGASTSSFLAAQQIAVNYDASGNTGLTVSKLKAARKLFLANHVDLDRVQLMCAITDDQDEDLLNEVQYTSMDFGTKPVLESGKLKSFLGINFVHCQRLATDASGYRRVPVFTKESIEFRDAEMLYTSINKVTTLRGEPWEAYAMSTFGSARTDNKLIVELKCAE